MVAGLERGDRRPDLVDDPYALMAQDAAGLTCRNVALEDVQIGPADRRLGDLHDRVGGSRDVRLGTLVERLLAQGQINEGFSCRHPVFLRIKRWVPLAVLLAKPPRDVATVDRSAFWKSGSQS